MKTCMNVDPAVVESTSLSLKLRRNWTAGEASDPKVAVAITHLGGVQGPVAVLIVVMVTDVVVDGVVTVVVTDEVVVVTGVVVVVVKVPGVTVNTPVAESEAPAFV